MTTISKDQPLIALINLFTVDRDNQQKLIDLLVKATEETMNKFPGFISANIHKSLDGTQVVNYAQWRSQEDFENMFKDPHAREHMQEAYGLAKSVEPNLYQVIFVEEKK